MPTPHLLDELAWRGLLHQATDEPALREHLNSPRNIYCGFDPTADSLTIGNLVPIMLLRFAQACGHNPIVIVGGATGLIGDPSGKSAERQLMTRDIVLRNVDAQRPIFARVLGPSVSILNNLDWTENLSLLDALRDVGKHFSVNVMIQKDSVRDRLQNREQGISFTEFSYQILQAYDYLVLRRDHNVTVQCGGSDQWGNIVAGADLCRRVLGDAVFAFTTPLVTKADGGKFGKTESGAVWLTAPRTSPYAFFQFWLNTDDRDLERFLKTFTLFPRERIEQLLAEHAADPGARAAHRALAQHVTSALHGPAEAEKAEAASRALFSGDIAGLDLPTLNEAFAAAPASTHARADLGSPSAALVDLLVTTGLAKSKREAREFLAANAVTINGKPAPADHTLSASDLLHNEVALLRRGKKHWHLTRWK